MHTKPTHTWTTPTHARMRTHTLAHGCGTSEKAGSHGGMGGYGYRALIRCTMCSMSLAFTRYALGLHPPCCIAHTFAISISVARLLRNIRPPTRPPVCIMCMPYTVPYWQLQCIEYYVEVNGLALCTRVGRIGI